MRRESGAAEREPTRDVRFGEEALESERRVRGGSRVALRRELHVGDRRADGDDARGHAQGAFYPYCIQTFFTHCSVSTLDRDHFQLTDAHFLYGIALKTLAMAGGDGGDGGKRHGGGPGTLGILTRVLRTHGVGALYRGYWPAMARQGPVMVIQMPIVEQFRRAFGLEYF